MGLARILHTSIPTQEYRVRPRELKCIYVIISRVMHRNRGNTYTSERCQVCAQ
jgi:hypothetical protein